ncbi:hypothetical protein EAN97_01240 [Klebsiella pneumoniae]|nr:hypothetical protein EAN97_01240 [Klebsiella pneumoniae]
MAIALMGAGFSATDTSDAVNILYPITMTVQANKAWQASGLKKSFFLPSHKKVRGGEKAMQGFRRRGFSG